MNIINFAQHNKYRYTEIDQPNSLAWMLLKHVEGGYESVTYKFKCKDFFNDFVLHMHTEEEFEVYGMLVKADMFNKGMPLPILLMNLKGGFHENVKTFLLPYMEQQGLPAITLTSLPANKAIMEIPLEYFQNTHFISALTLLVRCCSIAGTFTTWDEMYAAQPQQEKPMLLSLKNKPPGRMPETIKKYFCYYGLTHSYYAPFNFTAETYKSATGYDKARMVHNCGVQAFDSGGGINNTIWA